MYYGHTTTDYISQLYKLRDDNNAIDLDHWRSGKQLILESSVIYLWSKCSN